MNDMTPNPNGQIISSLPVVTPMTMIERAIEKGADVAMIEKLMELQERNDRNIARRAFDLAIAAAKAEIPSIRKNRKVDFTTSKGRTSYAHEDMAEISRTVDPILSRYGLAYRYRTTQDGRNLVVTCILSHQDGYSEETTLSSASDESGNKNHIQAVGSAATYLQRYTLKMSLGLAASEDDDGRRAEQVQRIDADQFITLQGLLEQSGADEIKFLAFLGAKDLESLTLKQFDTAVSALRKKIAQKGAA
ncbi:ERF family protein [Ketogulonicigenium vulgare]|uniref:ERF family protein n=1 Tax=Ketogulonicigenium vulgare TaxID=92945 RepID=UPI0023594DE3|nr:ERF family protein [Ketogulonicigenium vulgare]